MKQENSYGASPKARRVAGSVIVPFVAITLLAVTGHFMLAPPTQALLDTTGTGEPGLLFADDFTGPDGSPPANWTVNRSAGGTGAGAAIWDNTLREDVILSSAQDGIPQYVQARAKTVQPNWSTTQLDFLWQMQTDANANTGQSIDLFLAPQAATGNVSNASDYLRVRVANGQVSLLRRVGGGSPTTIWSGPITSGTTLRQFQLRIDGTNLSLYEGAVGSSPTLRVGPIAHGLTWTSGYLYLHAHNSSSATPYRARFDTVRIYDRGGTDATAPTVSGVAPAEGAKDVAATANAEATFSEAMDLNTISTTTFTLTKQSASQPLTAQVSYDAATKKATLDPTSDLEAGAPYTATLKGGVTGMKDLAGNPLAADKTWSFTTAAPADTTAPETTIDSGPSGTLSSNSATFAFSSNEAGSTFECSLDGAAFTGCTSPKDYTNLSDGSHTFEVKATDTAGNVSQTVNRTWTVDAASVIMAAGNIACNATVTRTDICQERATSDLLLKDSLDAVLPLGDDQYECGYLKDFNKYYERSWGRTKSLTRPILGNHEYATSFDPANPCYNAPTGAPGYFQYFGNAASPTEPGCVLNCKGYYSYDLGSWHIIALNSICGQVGGCFKGSPQEVWLRNDLAAHPTQCTLAYWHYPRFSSSESGTTYTSYLSALWQDLYNAKAEVVLNAHDHVYERFAPMDTAGNLDRANGIREFIVGTGGKKHMSLVSIHPNSEVRNADTYGVLKMTLRPSGYDWKFMPTAGSTFSDSGSESCH